MTSDSGSAQPESPDDDPVETSGSSPSSGWWPPSSRVVVVGVGLVVVLLLVLVPAFGQDDGDDDEETNGTVPRPTTTLADCPAEPADPPEQWPLLAPDVVVITSYEVTGNDYVATGVTNDQERALVGSMEETLEGYTFDEPTGDVDEVVVEFRSLDAEGSVVLSDEDDDACWDVVYEIRFDGEPDASQLQDVASDDTVEVDPVDPDADSGLLDPVGGGTVTTARGSFPLTATVCELDPIAIEASTEVGDLVVTRTGSGPVSLQFSYDDGVVVSDDDANASVSSSTNALIIGNGSNDEGPETILVEIDCLN